jgi:hypothetical protein
MRACLPTPLVFLFYVYIFHGVRSGGVLRFKEGGLWWHTMMFLSTVGDWMFDVSIISMMFSLAVWCFYGIVFPQEDGEEQT